MCVCVYVFHSCDERTSSRCPSSSSSSSSSSSTRMYGDGDDDRGRTVSSFFLKLTHSFYFKNHFRGQTEPICFVKGRHGLFSRQRPTDLNINACMAIVDTIRTTLGPRGLDKLVAHNGGGRRLRMMDHDHSKEIVHPERKHWWTLLDRTTRRLRWNHYGCFIVRRVFERSETVH